MPHRLPAAIMLVLISCALSAETVDERLHGLDARVQTLKAEMLDLAAEIALVEQQIYPAESRLKLFISMAPANGIELESASLRIDDVLVHSHLYTESENRALDGGGIQRYYDDILVSGEHGVELVVKGRGPDDEPFSTHASFVFNKPARAVFVEAAVTEVDTGVVIRITRQ